MFTIDLRKGVFSKDATLSAKAPSLDNALSFVRTLTIDGMIIATKWSLDSSRYVLHIYDWYDCWFTNPSAIARITAPAEFIPST